MEKLDNTQFIGKGAIALLMSWVSAHLGILIPVMALLCATMLLDFITAWSAAKINGEPINSKTCSKGILKKIGYLMGVACGLIVDTLIILVTGHVGVGQSYEPIFGLLVAIWLILNELVSILENLSRSGVHLPPFLIKIIQSLKIGVEQTGTAAKPQQEENNG